MTLLRWLKAILVRAQGGKRRILGEAPGLRKPTAIMNGMLAGMRTLKAIPVTSRMERPGNWGRRSSSQSGKELG